MQEDQDRLIVTAMKRLHQLELYDCIDPEFPESRPHTAQLQVLKDIETIAVRVVRAGNQSGKSAIGGRETSWIFENKHPYIKVPDAPKQLLVIGRVGEQVESELWIKKIKPFLTTGTYKEVRTGNSLQRVEHLTNGNVIIFMSHHNVNEAREKAQGFTAFYVWIDEQCGSLSLITELVLRILSKKGRLLFTFTPLIKNQAIHKWAENLDLSIGKLYSFNMLDNPVFAGRTAEILAQLANVPDAERRSRLYGEPYLGDLAVFTLSDLANFEDPVEYHPSWRHVEIVDPAASANTGFLLMAQSPANKTWYVVKADYIAGAAASDLLPKIVAKTEGLNIVRKVSDPHEVWFIKEACKAPWRRNYMGVADKARRKLELIKNTQERIYDGTVKIASWCVDLKEELSTCQWADNGQDKIAQSTKYHLLDCLQYGLDNLPKNEVVPVPVTHDQWLKQANKDRKAKEATRAKFGKFMPKSKLGAFRGRRWSL